MPVNVTAINIKTALSDTPFSGGGISVVLSEIPNRCPICHFTIEPDYLSISQSGTPFAVAFDWAEGYFRCTNMQCRRHFVALYRYAELDPSSGLERFNLERCDPTAPSPRVFDPVVVDLSPNFIQTYAQSSAAEDHGLTEIAGPGFRKALEFLIKDYAIQLNPQREVDIKQGPLAQIITEYLPGDKLAVVSSRAVWLGNDETHYERRWIGKNLQDLKKLIDATAHFIAMERLVEDLPTDMPATGPATVAPTS
jgi:hypothetical protein